MAGWTPEPAAEWQLQLSKKLKVPSQIIQGVQVYDIDAFDNSAETVAKLHALGCKAIGYISAGTYEDWRPDAKQFDKSLLGKPLEDWDGERWLDIRNPALRSIMTKRIQMCAAKGFLAVDPDNVDAYDNNNGMGLTAQDQLQYNTWLVQEVHAHGMAVALKNCHGLIPQLAPYFDFAVSEECAQYGHWELYQPFLEQRKAVLNVEYEAISEKKFRSEVCPRSRQLGISSIKKQMELGPWRLACPSL